MDRITKSLISDLLSNLELQSTDESKDFERFVNYTIVTNDYNKTFDIENISIGNGGDTGIDGIAIIVNGQLIENIQEIDDLLSTNGYIDAEFIFIQSKTSSNFDVSLMSTFAAGVSDLFATEPKFSRNDDIIKYANLVNHIYNNAAKLKKNPTIKLYYITTGVWVNDNNLLAVMTIAKQNLEASNLFSKISFIAYGASELAQAYRKTKESIATTINFSNRITIPSINGVEQAYIGLLPFSELLKILSNDDGVLLNVFEDNVRDFQGNNNDVNGSIESTIASSESEIFSVLNNGITIVASTISPTGDKFTITDYQIVNGCQTSNVLYNNKDIESVKNIVVPIKLIATNDEEIKTRITLATNNQTPIKKEQLASLTQFQRNLEQYFNAHQDDQKLYYERRSKQYSQKDHILKSKIITVPYQIKSFASMFLDEPHNVTSFFGYIVKRLNEGRIQIFAEDHAYAPYYTSAFAYYRLEQCFKRGSILSEYKKVRFHILMILRVLICPEELPPFNSQKKMERYCNAILNILNDDTKTLEYFTKCIDVINNSDFDKNNKQDVKLASKTRILFEKAKTYIS